MKNRTKSALTLVVALIAFVFVSPNGAFAINQLQVATVANLSLNSGSNSAVNFNSAKCGASNKKTVKTDKKKKETKCGSKGAKTTKITKKGATSKCGSKADSTKMKAKKAQGKCGQGKCGGSL